jgi:hypothetical protein
MHDHGEAEQVEREVEIKLGDAGTVGAEDQPLYRRCRLGPLSIHCGHSPHLIPALTAS